MYLVLDICQSLGVACEVLFFKKGWVMMTQILAPVKVAKLTKVRAKKNIVEIVQPLMEM